MGGNQFAMSLFWIPKSLSVTECLSNFHKHPSAKIPAEFTKDINASFCGSPREVIELLGALGPSKYTVSYKEFPIESSSGRDKNNNTVIHGCYLTNADPRYTSVEAYGL